MWLRLGIAWDRIFQNQAAEAELAVLGRRYLDAFTADFLRFREAVARAEE